ncbi:MAG: methyltransferase domain-containing protein [candidate division Zixibacteria bacterium]|nr:methyltransferase domain-containing protein [candidate division Zixibacteria bacterium]
MKPKASVVSPSTGLSTRTGTGLITDIFRKGFLARLGRFKEGKLTVVDGQHQWVFGEIQADLNAVIEVTDQRFYRMIALGSSIGAAEAYIKGYWSTNDLVSLVRIIIRNMGVFTARERAIARAMRPFKRLYHRLRDNTIRGSKRNILAHYDLSNDFYNLFLDRTMTYSCAVFDKTGISLEDASIEKLGRICRKLKLSKDDHLLEIGSGWGSFALYAALNYGCRVTTTTISDRQYEYTIKRIKEEGFGDRVTVLNKDYRELEGQYDKIASIEMIEAVGLRHLPVFLHKCSTLLKPDGLMALQAITISDQRFDDYRRSVDFIQTMVFPGASLISISNLMNNLRKHTDMRPIDLEDITPHYSETLSRWRERFLKRLDDIRRLGFTDEFIRLWDYYLGYCEGGFREEYIGDIQLLLAKPRHRISGYERGVA